MSMRDIIVALDLETTGLDIRSDQIIEIGAVKFQGSEILDEWQTLVYPGCSIPSYISQLTGLRNKDVEHAPRSGDVLPGLRRFLGDMPLLGHNIGFDVEFLQAAGLRLRNPLIDTYSVASTLLPDTPRYSLSALAALYNIPTDGAHRALNDTYMSVSLHQKLWQEVMALPLQTLEEIVQAGRQMPWNGALFFEAALQERARTAFVEEQPAHPRGDQDFEEAFFGQDEGRQLPVQAGRSIVPVDVDRLTSFVEPGGVLSAALTGYEYRPQQKKMIRAIAGAFNDGQHLLIEAPTGVGKSLSYLIPAIHFAVKNEVRVVISTNTLNLQEQLRYKDIPLLQQHLGIPFRAAVLKGRSNYLCPRRLASLRRRGPTSADEMQILARLLVWLTRTDSGDRSQLTLRGPVEENIWRHLSAESEGCSVERCMVQMAGTCPFFRAKQAADSAHILIVNHALLLSDVQAEGHVLPEYRYLVVDEAHHLEDATTAGLSFYTDPYLIQRQLSDLGTAESGLLGELLERCRSSLPRRHYERLEEFVTPVIEASSYMGHHVSQLFKALHKLLQSQANLGSSDYAERIRIVNALRRQPGWEEIQQYWDNLSQFTSTIAGAMANLVDGLRMLADSGIDNYDDLVAGVSAASRSIDELHHRFEELINEPDANAIYWAELRPGHDYISLHVAPLDIGPMLQKHIWHTKDAVVLTSATLRTNGAFDYIRHRLLAEDANEMVIESAFDYQSSTLLYVPNDIPEPAQQDVFQQAVEEGILALSKATQGRALVLFTSYAQLRMTANAIGDELERAGIAIYDQSDGSSRAQLLDEFVRTEQAVLMGTRSFWEGIDIPGTDLSALVIVRLPFNVPSDPIFAARGELFDNPFIEYAIPEAIIRFRQGFGRLIRRKTDRGVVAIFDRRVISKRYGSMFLESLPKCTVRMGRLADLPSVAVDWLSRS
jgi:ATP-dependent DNA helicase DinG